MLQDFMWEVGLKFLLATTDDITSQGTWPSRPLSATPGGVLAVNPSSLSGSGSC